MIEAEEKIIKEVERNKRIADHYYDNFRAYREKKDLSKASEYLWGALNALVYAIGLLHGEKLGNHGKIKDFVMRLADAYGDEEMKDEIAAAEGIHANFFHDFMDDFTFEVNREKMERLLEKLAEILKRETGEI